MKIAFCFAGQGAQAVGMGRDFYEKYESVKALYDANPEIKELCFEDKAGVLNQTAYAQKAMLLTSYAIASCIRENGIEPEYACGLSLGEYSALTFADVWNIKDALDIITCRGNIMQNALPLGTTKMAAIIGLSREVILDTIKNVEGVCEIANYNCPGQIVITGDAAAIDKACPLLLAAGARRGLPLNVSGAFHSSLLTKASQELRSKLDEFIPHNPKYKIVYNVTGTELKENINDILERQICHSVYFEDSIRYMIDHGVDTFVEIGPGATLSSFIKKTSKDVAVYNVSTTEGLEALLEALK